MHYLNIILYKSYANLISEARRGYLGLLWWVLEPVLYMVAYYLFFVTIMHRGGQNQIIFLLSGLVAWKWFATTILPAAGSIITNRGLINQVYLPKFVLPVMATATSTMKFIIVFSLLLIMVCLVGQPPTLSWLALPAVLGAQLLAMLAIGGLLAAVVPFFPDLKLVVENVMLFLFFMSGVFFEIRNLSTPHLWVLYLNPMAGLIEMYRCILVYATWPDWRMWGLIVSASGLVLAVALWLLRKYDRVYVKIV